MIIGRTVMIGIMPPARQPNPDEASGEPGHKSPARVTQASVGMSTDSGARGQVFEGIALREAIQIISVNVGRSETILHRGETHRTGIRKRSTSGPVYVSEQGLAGDAVVDTRHHGGSDQAVYVYRDEDYRWWAGGTGRDFPAGIFGENLTIRGLPENLYIGDRLLIGDVVLEATAARIPCGTLAAAMADSGFGLTFRKAERPGTYFRVLNPGELAAGDTVTLIEAEDSNVSVLDLFRFAYQTSYDADELRRILAAPIGERVRAQVEQALARTKC